MKEGIIMRSAESLTYWEWLNVLEEAIRQFNEKETYLIKNDLSERCINSKLAMYVERVLEDQEIEGVDVDVEYNRGFNGNESGIKRFKGGPVYLDLVVHQREYDVVRGFLNYIYVEMKKPQNPDGFNTDRSRVCDMTNPFGGFGYKIGAFLIIVADDTRNHYCLEIHDLYKEGLAWELLEDNPR